MITTLQVNLGLILDAVVDHRIEPIAFADWGDRASHAVVDFKQLLVFILVCQINIPAELNPEVVLGGVVDAGNMART